MVDVKKTIKLTFLFCLFPLLLFFNKSLFASASSQSITALEFNFELLIIHEVNESGKTYKSFSLPDGGLTAEPGQPQLPFKRKLVPIPDNVQPEISFETEIGETYYQTDILPAPYINIGLPFDKQITYKEYCKPSEAYFQDKNFPSSVCEIENIITIRGEKFAVIRAYPLQYNPTFHKVEIINKVSVLLKLAAVLPEIKSSKRSSLLTTQESSPSYPMLKIKITKEGIYKLTGKSLKKSGFTLSGVDPATFKMYYKGVEVPIIVKTKKSSSFGNSDYIEFYGEKNDSQYSDTSVYWLSAGGDAGKRISYKNKGLKSGGKIKKYFTKKIEEEENTEFIQTLPEEPDKDHWFWKRIYSGEKKSFDFNVSNISSASNTVKIEINLQGLMDDTSNPDHNTKVSINDKKVDEFSWDGTAEELRVITTTRSVLQKGVNSLAIQSTSSANDYIVLNNFSVSYPSAFKAVENRLFFSENDDGSHTYKVSGIKGNANTIQVFDITDPFNVKSLKFKSKGKYISFYDVTSGATQYLAAASNTFKSPDSVELVSDSAGLKDTSNGADYIIVTHDDFEEQANALAQFHESEGMRVKVAKINDVYNDFSNGFYDPQAIRDFIEYAYNNWQAPKPSYVLLFGDANFDYKNYLKTNTKDFIPTKLVDTSSFGPTPSDTWYACVDGDDSIPDLYIGRISASSAGEAESVISKTIEYADLPSDEAWLNNVALVADDPDDGGDFEALCDALESEVPVTYSVQKIYLSSFTNASDAKDEFVAAINSGALVAAYAGHGSVTEWAAEELFTVSDISLLSNQSKYPFIANLNCLTGYYASADDEKSLGEALLKAENAGAVAFFGPTGLGYNNEYEEIGKELFSTIFNSENSSTSLGESVTNSLINAYTNHGVSEDYFKDMVILGDPALKLKISQ